MIGDGTNDALDTTNKTSDINQDLFPMLLFPSQVYLDDACPLESNYKHECNTCGKRFVTPSKLSRHILSHTGERPHTCQFCFRQFSQFSNMKLHILKIHGVDLDCMVVDPAPAPSDHLPAQDMINNNPLHTN